MEPKKCKSRVMVAPFLPSNELLRFFIVFGPLWHPPGPPLASLLTPFGSLWASFWRFLSSFGLLSTPLGLFWAPKASHRQRKRNFGKILPRSCRDSAENVPRTRQEQAENPPYEPQAKLPFKLQVLRNDFVRRRTLSQNRLE